MGEDCVCVCLLTMAYNAEFLRQSKLRQSDDGIQFSVVAQKCFGARELEKPKT